MFDFILHYYLSKFINKLDILSQRLDHSNSLYDNKNMILLKPEYITVYALKLLAFKEKKHGLLTDIHQENRAG